jgi:glutamate-ammonia-ligase adenylyltransferase
MLDAKIDCSTYLTGLRQKYPELAACDQVDSSQPFKILEKIVDAFVRGGKPGVCKGFSEFESLLIETKAKFAYHWSLIELADAGTFAERGAFQTRFAELSIDLALQWSWQLLGTKQPAVQRVLEANNGEMPGMFLFGMGKLGGGDLNFSSDVDLIAYFDPDDLPIPDMLGKSYICHQALRTLTSLLGQRGSTNFVWRVDWRLRPNASATTLAMSTVAALDYYFYRASPWHRLALMKARVIAGDRRVGKAFMNEILRFIWRQNLDFRALDELGEIKNKINLEHPSLRTERQWREPINDQVAGFNVKLGSGGIREIEFVANALQLVWGGKQYPLRQPNTLIALAELARFGHLKRETVEKLATAYRYLRRVENALQIAGNQQTHLIPESERQRSILLQLLGISSWSDFVSSLNQYRNQVSKQFESIFAEQAQNTAEIPHWPDDLSTPAEQVTRGWEKGFLDYGVSIDLRHRLRKLNVELARQLRKIPDPDSAVLRLHNFFRSLPQGEQYLRLLAESPALLSNILPPLLYSPPMASLLKQSPHIIDCFMVADHINLEEDFDSDYVMQADQYETRLERLRRFVNEQLYQLYLMFLKGTLEVVRFQTVLTSLAEHTMELALEIVGQQMGLSEPPITVIGMGKMGVGKMAPMSDLDLIFVFDPQRTDIDTASRFVARLQTAISTPMREGVVYELDTRLRPSGRSGAPTVSIDSFRTHQLERAHTWEHIALVSARVVAGDRGLCAAIDEIKAKVIGMPREAAQFRKDSAKMWSRIAQHRIKSVPEDTMFSKLRPGGVMQTEYLAACLILNQRLVTSDLHFDDLLAQAIRSSELHAAARLPKLLRFWHTVQLWERLLAWQEKPLSALPKVYAQRLLAQCNCASLEALASVQDGAATEVERLMDQLLKNPFADQAAIDAWVETKVLTS